MTGDLSGKRILIVEDEYFLAADLKRALAGAGAEVVGPIGDLEGAILLIEQRRPDAAVLDVSLGAAFSYTVADRLAEAKVPHMFVTGYDGWSLPSAYQATPRVSKPFNAVNIVLMVEGLCAPKT